jgi:glutamate-1-semialdehyde 2,1-aminomutase
MDAKERALKYIPDGTQTYSKGYKAFPDGVPFAVFDSCGPYVWDTERNRYIDWTAALCALGLGHSYPPINEAISKQMERGWIYGLPSVLEGETAEALCEATGYDMVRFCKNGSDATSAAVRLARAVTGRDYIVKFKGHYHGCADWSQAHNPKCFGIPDAVKDCTLEIPAWDFDFLERRGWIRNVAAIIIEPVQLALPPICDFQRLRRICDDTGTLLIYDEVITGFRMALGGAGEWSGVRPDLACFGKAIANGMPLSALLGKREYMEQIGGVFISHTYGGEALSLAACKENISEYQKWGVIDHIARIGKLLGSGIRHLLSDVGLPFTLIGEPWRMQMNFGDYQNAKARFLQLCFRNGIMTNGQFLPMFAHSEHEVVETIAALARVFIRMKEDGIDFPAEGHGIEQVGVR